MMTSKIHRLIFSFMAVGCLGLGCLASAPVTARKAHPAFIVHITGQGRPMILIPGLASSYATWNTTVAHYKTRYTCYVLNLAGFAGVRPIHRPLLPAVRRELAAYIRRHHLRRPVIIGHSLGGNIALALAEHDPKLVGPVVIVDSLPFYAGAWFGAKNLAAAQPTITAMRQGMAHETLAQYRKVAQSGAEVRYMAISPRRVHELEQWSLDSDMATVNRAVLELVGEDLRLGLSRINSPVLVLGTWIGLKLSLAAYHVDITRAGAIAIFQAQYRGLPHLHFAMSNHARHFIMWDDPAWFFRQLDGFLAQPMATTRQRGFEKR